MQRSRAGPVTQAKEPDVTGWGGKKYCSARFGRNDKQQQQNKARPRHANNNRNIQQHNTPHEQGSIVVLTSNVRAVVTSQQLGQSASQLVTLHPASAVPSATVSKGVRLHHPNPPPAHIEMGTHSRRRPTFSPIPRPAARHHCFLSSPPPIRSTIEHRGICLAPAACRSIASI